MQNCAGPLQLHWSTVGRTHVINPKHQAPDGELNIEFGGRRPLPIVDRLSSSAKLSDPPCTLPLPHLHLPPYFALTRPLPCPYPSLTPPLTLPSPNLHLTLTPPLPHPYLTLTLPLPRPYPYLTLTLTITLPLPPENKSMNLESLKP